MMTMKPGMKTRKKEQHSESMFSVILQNLRPSGVFFSEETVFEKFKIAREKWW